MAQCFYDTFGPIEGAYLRQHMCRVRSLSSSLFEPPSLFAQRQHCLQEAFFSSQCHQACAKLAQNGVVKSCIGQFQAQAILPIEPTAYGISGLAISQILHKLEDGNQGQTPRSIGWLSATRIQISKQLILINRA